MIGYLFEIAFFAFAVYVGWKTFEKSGYDGFLFIIPIVNIYFITRIAKVPSWWGLLLFIPVVNLIFGYLISKAFAQQFGIQSLPIWILNVAIPILIPSIIVISDLVYQNNKTFYR